MNKSAEQDSLDRFGALCARAEENIDLAEGALLISEIEYPELDITRWLARIDALAAAVRPAVDGAGDDLARLAALTDFLFHDHGLCGNDRDYYDPCNSFLSDVIDRRMGIPISLAVLCMAVGKRVGVTLEGVGLPAHFLMKFRLENHILYIDPFNEGQILTAEGCRTLLESLSDGRIPFRDRHLDSVGTRQILARMLRNLKAAYLKANNLEKALAVTNRILLLEPATAGEYRDRGLLYLQRGSYGRALADLERYLAEEPGAPDRTVVEARAAQARTEMLRCN